MIRKNKYRGIIFDMDNTLLQSKINYEGMKKATFILLEKQGFLPADFYWRDYTTSQLIELARGSGRLNEEVEKLIWETVVSFEKEGMHNVALEPGVKELLDRLHNLCRLVVLTNNALSAALIALEETGVVNYFDQIVGREQMVALKPSPSGVEYIMEQYPDIAASDWLLVGDSWIDGKAAQEAGVPFLAYQADVDDLKKQLVDPVGYITHLRQVLNYL